MITEKTKVYFRRYRDGCKEVVAVFPEIVADNSGNLLCYQHIGPHGVISPAFIVESTETTLPDDPEVTELKNELTQIGYDLEIL